jgi:hypothetical protein
MTSTLALLPSVIAADADAEMLAFHRRDPLCHVVFAGKDSEVIGHLREIFNLRLPTDDVFVIRRDDGLGLCVHPTDAPGIYIHMRLGDKGPGWISIEPYYLLVEPGLESGAVPSWFDQDALVDAVGSLLFRRVLFDVRGTRTL